jgi:hypothetical protein
MGVAQSRAAAEQWLLQRPLMQMPVGQGRHERSCCAQIVGGKMRQWLAGRPAAKSRAGSGDPGL